MEYNAWYHWNIIPKYWNITRIDDTAWEDGNKSREKLDLNLESVIGIVINFENLYVKTRKGIHGIKSTTTMLSFCNFVYLDFVITAISNDHTVISDCNISWLIQVIYDYSVHLARFCDAACKPFRRTDVTPTSAVQIENLNSIVSCIRYVQKILTSVMC